MIVCVADKHHKDLRSLSPAVGLGRQQEEQNQVIHNAIPHHPPTNAQPAPEQQQPSQPTPPIVIVPHDTTCYGTSLWSARVRCPDSVTSPLLVHT